MRNLIVFMAWGCAMVYVTACQQGKRYRTDSGLVYTVYSNEKDSIAKMGSTAKVHFIQQAGDSIVDDTYDRMPLYYLVMPGYGNRYNPLEVFDYGLRKGDSVVTVQIVDSMVSKGILDSIPKWMKPGDKWTTRFKVLDVFVEDSLLQADKMKEADHVLKLQKRLGLKRLQDYLDRQDIHAVLWKDSLFFQEIQKGESLLPKIGDQVTLDYSLVSLRGKKLTDTRDSLSQGPATFLLGGGFMPAVLENQIIRMPLGSHFKLYIPGVLLFGVQSQSKEVRVEDDWIVDIRLYPANL